MFKQNKKLKFLFFIFLMMFQISFCQERIISEILKKNKTGKSYFFDYSSKKNGYNKVIVNYLGDIKTNKNMLKILIWESIWGKNRHNNGIIYIYDSNNHYLGKYYLGSGSDLPSRIENSFLIFENKKKPDCDTKLITKIDFIKGIPKEIFLKCNGDSGDFYSFVGVK